MTDNLEVRADTQRHFHRLEKWADGDLLKFNRVKCRVLHWERTSIMQQVQWWATEMEAGAHDIQRELGCWVEKLGCFVLKKGWLGGGFLVSVFRYLMGGCGEDRLLEVQRERVRSNGLMLQQEKF
ncbi:hypothetical protein QYF61_003070 [Mycteria americana]|uniref:Uncharacterized protein n=1 Tax=Mycteria americana TaxID=33587 RepID=A0AAN7NGN7_MYCAM|nr:hypothetical protein QYF61_003070 [Mycteria americana]